MQRISKKQKSDLDLFLECWNIYSGIYLETDGETSRRMEAGNIHAEMCAFLGKKSITIAKGIRMEADYFPIDTGMMEFDWIVGFTLYIDNLNMGMVKGISKRNNRLYVVSDRITIGFKVGEDGEISS